MPLGWHGPRPGILARLQGGRGHWTPPRQADQQAGAQGGRSAHGPVISCFGSLTSGVCVSSPFPTARRLACPLTASRLPLRVQFGAAPPPGRPSSLAAPAAGRSLGPGAPTKPPQPSGRPAGLRRPSAWRPQRQKGTSEREKRVGERKPWRAPPAPDGPTGQAHSTRPLVGGLRLAGWGQRGRQAVVVLGQAGKPEGQGEDTITRRPRSPLHTSQQKQTLSFCHNLDPQFRGRARDTTNGREGQVCKELKAAPL